MSLKNHNMGDIKESDMTKVISIPDNSYIRMLDASGNSVQIDKASFIEAIRNALPVATTALNGLLSANDKSLLNGIRIVKISTSGGAAPHLLRETGLYIVYGYDSTTPSNYIIYIAYSVKDVYLYRTKIANNVIDLGAQNNLGTSNLTAGDTIIAFHIKP